MNNYLIILSGLPRGGNQTWNSIIRNVVKPLDADLAICTGKQIDKSSVLYKNAKYKWLFDEYDDWFNYYEENFDGYWKEVFDIGYNTGLYNSGSVHFAIKDIVKKNYLSQIKKYDFLIYSRFDQFFVMNHPKFNDGNIWIPEGENYTGICDRHVLLPTMFAEDYLDICNFIDNKILDYEIPEYLNCEAVYKMHLKDIGIYKYIKRHDRFQFTTAKKTDFTRWRIPEYKLFLYNDINLKYPNELLQSVETLIKRNKVLSLLTTNCREFLNFLYLRLRISLGKIKRKTNKVE